MKKPKNPNTTTTLKSNTTTKKRNPEEKEPTDPNTTGTEKTSLSKPKFLKPLRKSWTNPTDKNSELNSTNLSNKKRATSFSDKSLSMNKDS